MKVKIKTKDNYFDNVKLKCTAVEYLILRSALRKFIQDFGTNPVDREKAAKMFEDMEGR